MAPRLYVTDSTIERLAPLLEARPAALSTSPTSWRGLFVNMQRYRNGSDREFWLEAWDGKIVCGRAAEPATDNHAASTGRSGWRIPTRQDARSFEGDADGVYARFLYAWPKEPPYARPTESVEEIEPESSTRLPD